MTRRVWVAFLLGVALLAGCSSGDGAGGDGDGGATPDALGDALAPPSDADLDAGADDAPSPGRDAVADGGPGGPDAAPGPDATSPDAASPDADRPDLAPADWCGRWPEAYCALLARCPQPGQETRSEADCRAAVGTGCDSAAVAAAVTAGRLAWDAAAAARCLAATGDLTCAEYHGRLQTTRTAPDPACSLALVGQVAPGGDCFLGTECAAGSLCTFGATCPGTCAAVAGPGADCGEEVFCDFTAAVCLDGTCAALPEAEDAPCLAFACRAPLLCDPLTETCRTPGLVGDACGGGVGGCLPGLLCFGDTGGGGTCQPLREAEETCFANGDCRAPLVCVGGTCGAAPGPGEPCFDFLCADAWCDTAAIPPTCTAWPAEGAACAPGSRCAPGQLCDAGTCRARRAAGAACTAHLQCAEGRCYGGECRARDAAACPEEGL